MSGNYIENYQKTGILISCNAYGKVMNNDIIGILETNSIAQNGIQFGYGAMGQIQRNDVSSNWYTGPKWSSTGILIFETDNVRVVDNVVSDNQSGIFVQAWGWYVSSADENEIINNDVYGSAYAISVGLYNWEGYTKSNVTVNNNKIVGNRIVSEQGTGVVGIEVFAASVGESGFSASTKNTKVHGNRIAGFEDEIVLEGDTHTKEAGNKAIEPTGP